MRLGLSPRGQRRSRMIIPEQHNCTLEKHLCLVDSTTVLRGSKHGVHSSHHPDTWIVFPKLFGSSHQLARQHSKLRTTRWIEADQLTNHHRAKSVGGSEWKLRCRCFEIFVCRGE